MRVGNPILHISPSRDKFGAVSGSTVALDLSGEGNNGTVTGATYVNDGTKGGRKALSCTDGVASNGVTAPLDITAFQAITLSLYLYPDSTGTNFRRYAAIHHSSSADDLRIYRLSAGNIIFEVDDGTGSGSYTASVPDDQWSHVALVHDGTNVKTYVNGSLVDTRVRAFNFSTATGGLYLARASTGNPQVCKFDDVLIYDRALSDDEILFLSGSRTQEFPEVEDGLIAHYNPSLDPGSVAEGSGILNLADLDGGTNGTLEGTAAFDETDTDKSGSAAFDFDGTDGCGIDVPASTLLSIRNTDQMTWSYWVYRNGANYDFLICRFVGGGSQEYEMLVVNNGNLVFKTYDQYGGAILNLAAFAALSTSTWHHVAITTDNVAGNTYIYIDGVQVQSSVGHSVITQAATSLVTQIGEGNSTYRMNGLIDNVKIYNRALSAFEIERQYERERPGVEVSYNRLMGHGTHNENTFLTANWLLQDNAASTDILDRTVGEDNTGTLQGAGNTSASSILGPTDYLPNAIDFDGTDDNVRFFNTPSVTLTGALTLSLRAKLDVIGTAQFLIGKEDNLSGIDGIAYRLYVDSSNKVVFYVSSDGGSTARAYRVSSTSLTSGQWYHITAIFEPSKRQDIVIDGSLSNGSLFGTIQSECFDSLAAMRFGGRGLATAYLNGALANVRFDSKDLNFAEVLEDYSGPEPLLESYPTITVAEVDTECSVTLGTPTIDSIFTGDNGVSYTYRLYWYLADDEYGTNETLVADTDDVDLYTPDALDEGKYLRVSQWTGNNGGFDSNEVWSSDPVEVQPASGGGSRPPMQRYTQHIGLTYL